MPVKKYVKKPIVVEAIQFTSENYVEVGAFLGNQQATLTLGDDSSTHTHRHGEIRSLLINTREGDMKCEIGDYIIKEPFPTDDRKFYPCKEVFFPDLYEEVTE